MLSLHKEKVYSGGKEMIEVGRVCLKIAGRDAGKKCVVVDLPSKNYALIDGQTRRRKCNIIHLEPLKEKLEIKKGAPHEEVVKELKKLGIETSEKRAEKRNKKAKGEKEKAS